MSEQGKKITRDELYAAVWSKTLKALAVEWNTEYLRLVRACEELEVPRPGQEYWPNIALGRTVEKTTLGARPDNIPNEWVLTLPGVRPEKRRVIKTPTIPKMEQTEKATPREIDGDVPRETSTPQEQGPRIDPAIEVVSVAESLHGAHPLVSQMRQAMLTAKPKSSGIVEVPWMLRVLNVTVSRAQTSRALRIMDALMKAVERRGAIFIKSKNTDCHAMHLSVGGEDVGFYLAELVNKTERPLKKGADPLALRWEWEKWDYQPTGNLKFRILESVPHDARRCWTDCTRYKLESKLGEIVEWIFVTGTAIKQARLAREEMWRKREEEHQRQEQERLRQEALRKKAECLRHIEEENRNNLEAAAQNWRESKLLRRFIRICEGELRKEGTCLATNAWQEQWLTWAREHADRLDPMTNGYLGSEGRRLTSPDVEATAPKPENQFGDNFFF